MRLLKTLMLVSGAKPSTNSDRVELPVSIPHTKKVTGRGTTQPDSDGLTLQFGLVFLVLIKRFIN